MIIRDLIDTRINYALTTDATDPEDVIALVDEVAALVEDLDTAGWTRHSERLEHLNADLSRGLDATPRALALKALLDGLRDIRAGVVAPRGTLPAEEWPAGEQAF